MAIGSIMIIFTFVIGSVKASIIELNVGELNATIIISTLQRLAITLKTSKKYSLIAIG